MPERANQEPISGNRFLAIIVVFHSKHPVRETNICNLDPYLFLYQLLISGHRPAQRECARTGLRSHARCHRPHPIPQPVKVGHTSGLRPLLFSNSDAGSFTSHKNKSAKVPWDGTYGFSSLSEKTRKSDVITRAALSSQLFKDPGCWSGRGLNLRPPLGRLALSQLS